MQSRMILAAAAFAAAGPLAVPLAGPALAECLEGRTGAQCDVFLERYRADEVPVGTTMVWSEDQFLVEEFDPVGVGAGPGSEFGPGLDPVVGDDVFFWDGETGHYVPENSGPPITIADW